MINEIILITRPKEVVLDIHIGIPFSFFIIVIENNMTSIMNNCIFILKVNKEAICRFFVTLYLQ